MTYLLTWNPNIYPFQELSEIQKEVQKGRTVSFNWSCRSSKPVPDDTFYLIRLGTKENAVIMKGSITGYPYLFASDYSGKDKLMRFVDIRIEQVNLVGVAQDYLKFICPIQCWSPQSSGILIKETAEKILSSAWNANYAVPISQ